MGHRERSKTMALGVHLNVTYLNVEREPRGTGALST